MEGQITSRLLRWEVWNFMSIEHGVCEFDARNIVNLKGYNDSGKSAMLRALDVLLSNIKPTKQTEFIQDSKDYFRVIAYFDDGVSILRDKYRNGQSLYEMYKDGNLIFTTKQDGVLVKITDVPTPIKDYVAFASYEDMVLNSRSCFEKQIGVQTSGSENYKLFNTVLKSEELTLASAYLNEDKNKKHREIDSINKEIDALNNLLQEQKGLTRTLIEFLKTTDANVDSLKERLDAVADIFYSVETKKSVPMLPELTTLDIQQLQDLNTLLDLIDDKENIHLTPELQAISVEQLDTLQELATCVAQLHALQDLPTVNTLDLDKIVALQDLYNDVLKYRSLNDKDKELAEEQQKLNTTKVELLSDANAQGYTLLTCPTCGMLFEEQEGHIDA